MELFDLLLHFIQAVNNSHQTLNYALPAHVRIGVGRRVDDAVAKNPVCSEARPKFRLCFACKAYI